MHRHARCVLLLLLLHGRRRGDHSSSHIASCRTLSLMFPCRLRTGGQDRGNQARQAKKRGTYIIDTTARARNATASQPAAHSCTPWSLMAGDDDTHVTAVGAPRGARQRTPQRSLEKLEALQCHESPSDPPSGCCVSSDGSSAAQIAHPSPRRRAPPSSLISFSSIPTT